MLGVEIADLVHSEGKFIFTTNARNASNNIGYNITPNTEFKELYESRIKDKDAEITRLQHLLEKVLSDK